MKIFFGVLFVLFCSSSSFAQPNRDEQESKQAVLQLFELVKKQDNAALAKHIVCTESYTNNALKPTCDYETTLDRRNVDRFQEVISKRYLPFPYEFVQYSSERDGKEEWHIWELVFHKAAETKKVYFAFLYIDDQFLLGDID